MQHDAHNLFPDGLPGDAPGRAAAVRAAADGELTPAQVESLRDEAFEGRLAFERGLRESVGRVMGPVSAPAGLRERILAAAQAARDADDGALADRLGDRAGQTRDRSFWAGQGRLVGALAAVLVLAIAGVFIVQSARLSGSPDMLAYRTDLARFVTGEHNRTLDERYADQKYVYKAVDDAVRNLGGELRRAPAVPPCGIKTQFRGASPCHVPGKGPSAHFQFTKSPDDGPCKTISMFVKQDNGELAIEEGQAYLIDSGACNVPGTHIVVWRKGGLLYTLVSAESNAPYCGELLAELGVREPSAQHRL